MISARRVVAELAALPLLWGEVRIERVRVDAPRLIADLDLNALAAWQLAVDASPEIVVTDGSGQIAVRIGDGATLVDLDRLAGRMWAGAIEVEAEGRAAGWPFAVEGTLPPGSTRGHRLDVRRLRLGDAELAGTLVLEPRYERARLVADLDAQTIALDSGLWRWADRWRGLAGLDIDAPLSLSALAQLDLALDVTAERVSVNGAELTDARLSLGLDNGRLEIAQARARHADEAPGLNPGVALSALVDRGERAFALDLAAGLPLAVLGLASAREGEPGHASIDAGLRARGLSPRHILASLEGSVRIALAGARVPRLDLETVDIVLPWLGEAKAIDLERLVVDLAAQAGVVTARKMVVETPRVALAIDGAVDFNEETVHLEIAPTVKDERIADQTVPLIVTGPLAAPAVLPNPAMAGEEAEP
jgi:uncharacterized protein involved in outer membrane biogenesis